MFSVAQQPKSGPSRLIF